MLAHVPGVQAAAVIHGGCPSGHIGVTRAGRDEEHALAAALRGLNDSGEGLVVSAGPQGLQQHPHQAVTAQPQAPQGVFRLIAHVVGDLGRAIPEHGPAPLRQVALQAPAAEQTRVVAVRR